MFWFIWFLAGIIFVIVHLRYLANERNDTLESEDICFCFVLLFFPVLGFFRLPDYIKIKNPFYKE